MPTKSRWRTKGQDLHTRLRVSFSGCQSSLETAKENAYVSRACSTCLESLVLWLCKETETASQSACSLSHSHAEGVSVDRKKSLCFPTRIYGLLDSERKSSSWLAVLQRSKKLCEKKRRDIAEILLFYSKLSISWFFLKVSPHSMMLD